MRGVLSVLAVAAAGGLLSVVRTTPPAATVDEFEQPEPVSVAAPQAEPVSLPPLPGDEEKPLSTLELARIAQDNAMKNVTPEMLDARRRRSERFWEHSRNRADYHRRIAEQREAAYWSQVAAAQQAANQRAEFMSHVRAEPVLTGVHGTSYEIGGGQRAYNFVPEYEYRYYYEP